MGVGKLHLHDAHSLVRIRDENLKSLIARKKLHLVLDLDNTLLQSKMIQKLTFYDQQYLKRPVSQKWLEEGTLHKWDNPHCWSSRDKEWVTKLRPNVQAFLKEASTMFDFSIFTLGTPTYARQMLDILDPKGLYFANSQVLTKEDCTTPLKKGLDLVLQHDRVVLVVDDIKEFWESNAKNLIEIAPYVFFENVTLPEKSWSRRMSDESEKYGELARVLRELKKIYREFYNMEDDDTKRPVYEDRDVRVAIDEVKRKFKLIGTNCHTELILKAQGYA